MSRNMTTTIQAMNLFMQSLPSNAKFSIVSFGTSFEYLDSRVPFDCKDVNIKNAKRKIETFGSNMGGTNIYEPLASVFSDNQYEQVPT